MFKKAPTTRSATRRWTLGVCLVENHSAQQSILVALRDLGRPGLTALGTHRGPEVFVIVDWQTPTDQICAKKVVMALDPHATTTLTSHEHPSRRLALRSPDVELGESPFRTTSP